MKLLCPRWRVAPPPTALCACRPGSAATSACSPISLHIHLALALSAAPNLQSHGFHFNVMPRQWNWRSLTPSATSSPLRWALGFLNTWQQPAPTATACLATC